MSTLPPQPDYSNDRLALLYHLSQTFNSSLDLEEVLNKVMEEVVLATRAERGFVMMHDDQHALTMRVARGLDQQDLSDAQVSISVIERVAHEGQPVLTHDAQTDARFNMRQSVVILGLRSILCVPLKFKDTILGVIYVDNRLQAGIFTPADLDLLNAIAATAAIAIENARLYQVAVEKGRLERELQVARRLQASLMPETTPEVEGWEFAARWLPARQVAGDYYDLVELANGRLGLLVADVTDKGMEAALFMALTRSTVRASVHRAAFPAEGINDANQLICADAQGGMFVTLFYGQLDTAARQLTYVNAGHNPPLHYQAATGRLTRLSRTGMALGVLDTVTFEQRTVQIEPGDFLLLYTDGVTDALNAAGQDFGMAHLEQLLLEQPAAPADQIVAALESRLRTFTGTGAPVDDITVLVARCLK